MEACAGLLDAKLAKGIASCLGRCPSNVKQHALHSETIVAAKVAFSLSNAVLSAGAVGLEALSRGCQECHFIEMAPAVARDSLARNIAECGLTEQATVHSMVSSETTLKPHVADRHQ